jgi:hypothetical protein
MSLNGKSDHALVIAIPTSFVIITIINFFLSLRMAYTLQWLVTHHTQTQTNKVMRAKRTL